MAEFQMIDAPRQVHDDQLNNRFITVPYLSGDEQLVGLCVEWYQDGNRNARSIVLSPERAVRLAKNLLCAADGNGDAGSFYMEDAAGFDKV